MERRGEKKVFASFVEESKIAKVMVSNRKEKRFL